MRNETAKTREISLSAALPAGWTLQSGTGKFNVGPMQVAAARIEIMLPMVSETEPKKAELQEVSVHAEASGQTIGDVKLRVELRKRTLPQ
jgi:hypothetical protein